MRPSFVNQMKPFLVSVVTDTDPDACICTMRDSEFEGAQAYDLHLRHLERKYHNYKDIRRIVLSTNKPVMTIYYRRQATQISDAPGTSLTDDERAEAYLMSIKAGASAIDMMGDLFDPSPLEISRKPEIVEKQKRFIEQIHTEGGEVILSSHTWVVMDTAQVLEHASELASRGADMVKIAAKVESEDDLVEAFKTTIAMKRELKVPFIHICMGEHGKIHRIVGPMLGSSLVFCVNRYSLRSTKDQPQLRATREVFNNFEWRPSRLVDEEL